MKRLDRTGEISYSNEGYEMMITKYRTSKDIEVVFTKCGHIVKTSYKEFKNGGVKNPYHAGIYNVGYYGVGIYKATNNGKTTKAYAKWNDMLRRCYNVKDRKNPTYIECSVCEEWHNFQNFAKWHEDNYYEIEGKTMCLDKDILVKGNKVYSPETCVYTPQEINKLFTKTNALRGDLPIGVQLGNTGNNYYAACAVGRKKSKRLGSYNTPEEAYEAYKQCKEQHIKEVAEQYKPYIPTKLYEAMLRYEVEITD